MVRGSPPCSLLSAPLSFAALRSAPLRRRADRERRAARCLVSFGVSRVVLRRSAPPRVATLRTGRRYRRYRRRRRRQRRSFSLARSAREPDDVRSGGYGCLTRLPVCGGHGPREADGEALESWWWW